MIGRTNDVLILVITLPIVGDAPRCCHNPSTLLAVSLAACTGNFQFCSANVLNLTLLWLCFYSSFVEYCPKLRYIPVFCYTLHNGSC